MTEDTMFLPSGKSQVLCSVWKLKSSCSHLLNLLYNYLYGITAFTLQWPPCAQIFMIHLKDYFSSISSYVSVAGSNRNRFDHQTAKADSLPFLAHGVKCNSCICYPQPLGQQPELSKLHRKNWPPTQVLSCWSTRNRPASTSSPAKLTALGNWPQDFWCVTNRSKTYKLFPLFTSNCIPAMLQKTRAWQEACVSRCVAPSLLPPAISSLPSYVFTPDCSLPIRKTDSHGNPSLHFSGHTQSLVSPLISLHLYLRCSNLPPSSQKCPALVSVFSDPLLVPHLSLVILTRSAKENLLHGSSFYNPGKGLEGQFLTVRQMEM